LALQKVDKNKMEVDVLYWNSHVLQMLCYFHTGFHVHLLQILDPKLITLQMSQPEIWDMDDTLN
jgi:hypothetical protein